MSAWFLNSELSTCFIYTYTVECMVTLNIAVGKYSYCIRKEKFHAETSSVKIFAVPLHSKVVCKQYFQHVFTHSKNFVVIIKLQKFFPLKLFP